MLVPFSAAAAVANDTSKTMLQVVYRAAFQNALVLGMGWLLHFWV
jgi:BarA-like signal transduction histidine kinase